MPRRLVNVTAFYLIGLLLAYYTFFSYRWSTCFFFLCFALAFLLPQQKTRNIFLCLTIIFLAAAWSGWNLQVRQSAFKPFWGKTVTIQGIVLQEPQLKNNFTTLLLSTLRLTDSGGQTYPLQEKIQLRSAEKIIVQPGEKIKIKILLQPLPQSNNPGQFSYGFYLATQGIKATGEIKGPLVREGLQAGYWVAKGKEKMQNNITSYLPSDYASITQGIVFGEAHSLPPALQESFTRVGLTHVLAASGQNMVIITTLFLALGTLLSLPLSWITLVTLAFIFLYTLAAGSSPSVVRAAIMAALALGASLFGRPRDLLTSVAGAGLLILFFQPLALWNVSFQLSFAAVLSLFFLTPYLERWLAFLPTSLIKPLALVLAVELGVTPLTIYYFQQFSLVAFLANIFILPFLEGVLILGLLLAVLGFGPPFLAQGIAGFLWLLLKIALLFTNKLASLPGALIETSSPSVVGLIFYYLALASFLYILTKRVRKKQELTIGALTCVLVVFGFIMSNSFSSSLKITFLDVGQGDAIFLQTPGGQNILLDGGGQPAYFQKKREVGEQILLPFFRKQGIRKLDLLLVSHFHEDHIGGLKTVLEQVPVKKLFLGQKAIEDNPGAQAFWQLVEEKQLPWAQLRAGQTILLDSGIVLQVLHPGGQLLEGTHSDLNNNSLVLKLVYQNFSLLLPGDLEAEGEVDLLARERENLASDVLKVGHHGSAFSSQEEFLQAVAPKIAVISVGRHNSFGHPSPQTLATLEKRKIKIYRTDRDGAIIIETKGDGYLVKTVKKENALF